MSNGSETQHNSAAAKRARLELFAEWLATPLPARVPDTQKALSEMLGVSEATLSAYKRDPVLRKLVEGRVRAAFGAEQLVAVIQNLYLIATEGSPTPAVQAAKTLLAWSQATGSEPDFDVASLSDEELAQLRKGSD